MRKLTLALTTLVVMLGLIATYAYAVRHDQGDNYHEHSLFSESITDKLQLTEAQQSALKQAREQITQLRDTYKNEIKEAHQKLVDTVKAQQASDNPDLAPVIAARKALKEKIRELHNKVLEIELGIYNQLTPEQKKIVFAQIQSYMEKMQKRIEQKRSKIKSFFSPQVEENN